jgi:hypothetical protein
VGDSEVPDFLNELLPLIDSINSIHFFDRRCIDLVYERFADKFFAAKVMSIHYYIVEYKPGDWVRYADKNSVIIFLTDEISLLTDKIN